jgi:hypothetical protein
MYVLSFLSFFHDTDSQILASPAAMQIRQLEALQNMARTSGSKVVFGKSILLNLDKN